MSYKKSMNMASSILIIIAFFALLLGCSKEKGVVSNIKKKGQLVVMIRNAPTIYYEGPEGPMGFEYELVKAFADHLGVELKLKVYSGVSEILQAVDQNKGDMASGAITRIEEREKGYTFGPDYYTVQQLLVYRRGIDPPDDIDDLSNYQIVVIEGSSYDQRLQDLKEDHPELHWETTDDLSTEQLMSMVWHGEIECTVADRNIVAINRRYYPGVEVAFPISEKQYLAWVLPDQKKGLAPVLKDWLDFYEESGKLGLLRDKYYGYVEIYDYVDIREFHKRIRWRLPTYRRWFEEAAQKYDLPWTLLAAMAYQESHWNRHAKSPTGVRGVMMLTKITAKSVGVENRLDPYQSIMGGAKYLRELLKRVPDSVTERDRLSYALASYNVGMAHMKDAQILAERLGCDPTQWQDLREVLPLLSQRKYYSKLKHGYARGTEPVRYVSRIMNYRDILQNALGLK